MRIRTQEVSSLKLLQKRLSMRIRLYFSEKNPGQALSSPPPQTEIKYGDSPRHAGALPKTIWMYWEQGSPPPIIRACIARIERLNPGFEVRVLDRATVLQCLEGMPAAVWLLPIEQRSDWVRLSLLHRHGGIWIDASCIVNRPLDWVLDIHERHGTDFIGFSRRKATLDPAYPIIDNWFLAAPADSRFVADWLREFEAGVLGLGVERYIGRIKADPGHRQIIQNIHDPYYLCMHVAGQIALRRHRGGPLHLTEAESSAFFYQTQRKWNRTQLHKQLLLKHEPASLPCLIKLTAGDRRYIDDYLKARLYVRQSIIGRLVAPEGAPAS